MYSQTTHQIEVKVGSRFLPEHSSEDDQSYTWVYEISITNQSDKLVQLLNRHWIITDLNGHVEEVKGPGVVGLQPIINPGETFSYSSFCVLHTQNGSMKGAYEMQDLARNKFQVAIPEFLLLQDGPGVKIDPRLLH
ncbi:MAG: ApaG domain protein [Gammaproteobacteria bacterium]|jgi:ApaG protein|nr:ApaG domain protein [Gammaproteobacteria bacterium]